MAYVSNVNNSPTNVVYHTLIGYGKRPIMSYIPIYFFKQTVGRNGIEVSVDMQPD